MAWIIDTWPKALSAWRQVGVVLAASAAAGGAAAAPEPLLGDYDGSDVGRVVLSVSASEDAPNLKHTLCFRGLDRAGVGEFTYDMTETLHGLRLTRPQADFTERLDGGLAPFPGAKPGVFHYSTSIIAGVTYVKRLAPGPYEVFWVDPLDGDCQQATKFYWVGYKTSVPFQVSAGTSVYLGQFRFVTLKARSFVGEMAPTMWFAFEVTDQSQRDMPIAKTKDPGIGPAVIAVAPQVSLQNGRR